MKKSACPGSMSCVSMVFVWFASNFMCDKKLKVKHNLQTAMW